ncbi:hypothetical protein SAMN05216553_10525 [Lentzea fradiae]|uniref:Uncharacterized protein n=1 Tax=Lentzea fradiae TaxID=200378 RepID=A0A1G7QZX0_9PSEU|nr:hypothetical protein SAMN05216553_10525 [Lentzea fradiae]
MIAEEWRELGASVAALSNRDGGPLARTVKLVLDPLVLRPALHPHLGGAVVAGEHVGELRALIAAAGPALAAAAAWFGVLKQARRRARITGGNPQDSYFQRCYELAVTKGPPGPDADRVADAVVAEIRDAGGEVTVERLRAHVTDPATGAELAALLAAAWTARTPPRGPAPDPEAVLAALTDQEVFDRLVAAGAGTAAAAGLESPGVARDLGLTGQDVPAQPALGHRATKRAMPMPFDRSVFERLFAAFTSARHRERMPAVPALVRDEISRCAQPWQLAEERGRLAMAAGRAASSALDPAEPVTAPAQLRMRRRWQREPYVQRALRMPASDAGVTEVRQAYLRRLWSRLHGRELRAEDVGQLRDLLDGALRSVILDQRDRVKAALAAGTA